MQDLVVLTSNFTDLAVRLAHGGDQGNTPLDVRQKTLASVGPSPRPSQADGWLLRLHAGDADTGG